MTLYGIYLAQHETISHITCRGCQVLCITPLVETWFCVPYVVQSEGQVLKEAMYINKSLSFLEQAILALADRRRDHVPFRQTKLTHALKDSLGEPPKEDGKGYL